MPADSTTELRLYVENTGSLYPRVRTAIKVMVVCPETNTFKNSAICKHCLQYWLEIVCDGARMYQKEIRRRSFSAVVIKKVAKEWAADYLKRLRSGEEGLYDK